jgi:hypothetical protein
MLLISFRATLNYSNVIRIFIGLGNISYGDSTFDLREKQLRAIGPSET